MYESKRHCQCSLFMRLFSLLHFSLTLCSGTSSVALAWSGTFDDLIGGVISKYFEEHAAMGLPGLAPYPDVFAAALIVLLSGKMIKHMLLWW